MRWGLLLAVLACAAHAGEWERVADRDGVVVERRSVEGASVLEVRATTHSPLPPAKIMATLWKQDEYREFVPYLKRLDVLQDDGDKKLIYEQIHVPFVKDRDVTLRATRTVVPETGEYEVTSIAVPEGPPESPDYVRVWTSESHWRLVPNAGGTAVTYTIRTDPGRLVPAWIVNAVQSRATAKLVRAMMDRALRNPP